MIRNDRFITHIKKIQLSTFVNANLDATGDPEKINLSSIDFLLKKKTIDSGTSMIRYLTIYILYSDVFDVKVVKSAMIRQSEFEDHYNVGPVTRFTKNWTHAKNTHSLS